MTTCRHLSCPVNLSPSDIYRLGCFLRGYLPLSLLLYILYKPSSRAVHAVGIAVFSVHIGFEAAGVTCFVWVLFGTDCIQPRSNKHNYFHMASETKQHISSTDSALSVHAGVAPQTYFLFDCCCRREQGINGCL